MACRSFSCRAAAERCGIGAMCGVKISDDGAVGGGGWAFGLPDEVGVADDWTGTEDDDAAVAERTHEDHSVRADRCVADADALSAAGCSTLAADWLVSAQTESRMTAATQKRKTAKAGRTRLWVLA